MTYIRPSFPCPVEAQHRRFTTCGLAILIGMGCVGLMGGLALKQDRKHGTLLRSTHGCYVWSDGAIQCTGRRASGDKATIEAMPPMLKFTDRWGDLP